MNNLVLQNDPIRDKAITANKSLYEDYVLHYLLDVEIKGSQSLLNIDAFNDPISYILKVKKPGSDEYIERAVDLIETFNYLIGLRLMHLGMPHTFTAAFTRLPDPDLPQDQDTKLVIAGNGKLKTDPNGKWWIRKVEGWAPKNPYSPNDGIKEKVLIVWRKLTGNLEEDNLILDSWFQKNRISTLDWEFDTNYDEMDLRELKDLSDKGDMQARFYLAAHYYYADDETQDYEEAAKMFKQFADEGNSDAQCILGEMYEYGYGLEPDSVEAARLYKLSAENGNTYGQMVLGSRYDGTIGSSENSEFGGLIKNNQEALFWYLVAYRKCDDEQSFHFLDTAIKRVKQKLDKEQIAAVEERVKKSSY